MPRAAMAPQPVGGNIRSTFLVQLLKERSFNPDPWVERASDLFSEATSKILALRTGMAWLSKLMFESTASVRSVDDAANTNNTHTEVHDLMAKKAELFRRKGK